MKFTKTSGCFSSFFYKQQREKNISCAFSLHPTVNLKNQFFQLWRLFTQDPSKYTEEMDRWIEERRAQKGWPTPVSSDPVLSLWATRSRPF